MSILFDIQPAVFHEESPLRFLPKYYKIIHINKEVCFMKRIQPETPVAPRFAVGDTVMHTSEGICTVLE